MTAQNREPETARDRILAAVHQRIENCRIATEQGRRGLAWAENCQTSGLLEALQLLETP